MEKEKAEWLGRASTEEILDKSLEENWNVSTFKMWTLFKIAQSLEKIAYRS